MSALLRERLRAAFAPTDVDDLFPASTPSLRPGRVALVAWHREVDETREDAGALRQVFAWPPTSKSASDAVPFCHCHARQV
jgi:hypothetical protein